MTFMALGQRSTLIEVEVNSYLSPPLWMTDASCHSDIASVRAKQSAVLIFVQPPARYFTLYVDQLLLVQFYRSSIDFLFNCKVFKETLFNLSLFKWTKS